MEVYTGNKRNESQEKQDRICVGMKGRHGAEVLKNRMQAGLSGWR